jgi:hypothetical protein
MAAHETRRTFDFMTVTLLTSRRSHHERGLQSSPVNYLFLDNRCRWPIKSGAAICASASNPCGSWQWRLAADGVHVAAVEHEPNCGIYRGLGRSCIIAISLAGWRRTVVDADAPEQASSQVVVAYVVVCLWRTG